MPKTRALYLHRYKTRHGKFYWYVRKPGGKRIRIKGEYDSPEFKAAYDAAIAGLSLTQPKPSIRSGSLSWLWERYRETAAWKALRGSTRRQRENIMDRILVKSGSKPYADIIAADIMATRDWWADKPSTAKGFLVCMRKMYQWALKAEKIRRDPTIGIEHMPKAKTEGFPIWTEEEVDRYQAKWKLGTRERVWLDVLLYTGLRRGDAVTLGRQHVRNGVFTLRTEKSGKEVIVCNPFLSVLAATVEAGPCGDLAFICGKRGQPLTKESFGNMFREACDAAGVFGKSAHGLRKVGATRAAENGATEHQLMALFGWTNPATAAIYTRAANRKRLAAEAGGMFLRTASEQSMCQPEIPACQPEKSAS